MQPLDVPRGQLRVHTWTMTSDAAKPISVAAGLPDTYVLTDAIVQVLTNGALMGDKDTQVVQMDAGTVWPFDYLPMADLWVKNATPGSNATFVVLGYMGPREQDVPRKSILAALLENRSAAPTTRRR